VRHQVEDYGGRPLSFDEAQCAGTIVDADSRETGGASDERYESSNSASFSTTRM